MKIVFSESDIKEIVTKAAMELAPIGTRSRVEIHAYSQDFATVDFIEVEPKTATEADAKAKEDKPIDLSEIPF